MNHIYLFAPDIKESVTSYLPEYLHLPIMKDLMKDKEALISDRAVLWCSKVSKIKLPTLHEVQKITIPFLNEALQDIKDEPVDLVIANILHRTAMIFSSCTPDSDLEDSLVHNFLSALFDGVFGEDTLLQSKWANGQLGGKRKNDESNPFKPDYVVFVTLRSCCLDLACVEAKSPTNKNAFPKSDLVKLGQVMRCMLNALVVEGVEEPVVGGVLVSGFKIQIYKMEIVDNGVYVMVEMGRAMCFRHIREMTLVPAIVANLVQLKNLILANGKRANKRLCDKAKGLPPKNNLPVLG